MRRMLVGVAGALALAISTLPVAASGATTRVDGADFAGSGLRVVNHGCADSRAVAFEQPKLTIRKGPGRVPIGTHSIGWAMPGTSYGIGPVAHVAHPSTLKSLKVRVYAEGKRARGSAVATYPSPNGEGVWSGYSDLREDTAAGWHVVEAADLPFSWMYIVNGVVADTEGAMTVAALARSKGGDGDGADVGFIYGCDGNTFFLDGLTVATDTERDVYDLGGYRSRIAISPTKVRLTYGERTALLTLLRRVKDDRPINGRITFQAKAAGAKQFRKFRIAKAGPKGAVVFRATPAKSTQFRAVYAGANNLEGSRSAHVRVLVRSNVTARLAKKTVIAGRTFTTEGRVLPRRPAQIRLQKFVKGKWRTVKKTKAGKDGRYAIAMKAPRPGKSYWRITTNAGGGNISGKSVWLRLKTRPKPTPPANGPGNPNPPTPPQPPSDPVPPPPVEPPPPPPPSRPWAG